MSKFGVAPPATAPTAVTQKPLMTGKMPLEVGKAVKVKKLSPAEEQVLLQAGWSRGDPIPNNFSELLKQVREIESEATDPDKIPVPETEGIKFDPSRSVDISTLPPEEQAEFRANMKRMWDTVKVQEQHEQEISDAIPPGAGSGVGETIRRAMSAGTDIEVDDSVDEVVINEPSVQAPARSNCPRCNFDLHMLNDPVIATDEDRDGYLMAMDALQPYTKKFKFFDSKITVIIRDLTAREAEAVFKQIMIDHGLKRVSNREEAEDLRFRYNMALQIIQVASKSKTYEAPTSLSKWEFDGVEFPADALTDKDTNVRKALFKLDAQDWPEAVYRLLASAVVEFDLVKQKLEANSREPGFWKPRTEGT